MTVLDDNGEPLGTWWCNSHGREATHVKPNGVDRCCAPRLGGIAIPCYAVLAPMTVSYYPAFDEGGMIHEVLNLYSTLNPTNPPHTPSRL